MRRFVLCCIVSIFFSLNAMYEKENVVALHYVVNRTPLKFKLQYLDVGCWKDIDKSFVGPHSTKDFSQLPFDLTKIPLRLYEISQGTYFKFIPEGMFITRPLKYDFDQPCAPLKIKGNNYCRYFGAVIRNKCGKNVRLGHYDKNRRWVLSSVKPDTNCGICWSSLLQYKKIYIEKREFKDKILAGDWTVFEENNKVKIVQTEEFEKKLLSKKSYKFDSDIGCQSPLKKMFEWKAVVDIKKINQ